ncbi:MAG: hypothetical protein ACREEC_08785 [Thermoplasmata archaeon]
MANDAKFCAACGHKVGTAQHALGETKAVTGKIGHGIVSGVKTLGADVKKVGKKKGDPNADPPPPPPLPPPPPS